MAAAPATLMEGRSGGVVWWRTVRAHGDSAGDKDYRTYELPLSPTQKCFAPASGPQGRALIVGELQTGSSIVGEAESVTRRESVAQGHTCAPLFLI